MILLAILLQAAAGHAGASTTRDVSVRLDYRMGQAVTQSGPLGRDTPKGPNSTTRLDQRLGDAKPSREMADGQDRGPGDVGGDSTEEARRACEQYWFGRTFDRNQVAKTLRRDPCTPERNN